jgi:ribosome-interacting GTPase 1
MPANLTPQYKAAEQKYREAKTPQEKLRALREMLAVMPKHKGTDHLQGDVKRKIAQLTDEIEQVKKGGGKRHNEYVPREGAGQVVLLGPPNSGKSSLVGALTHASPEVGPYPFTTKKPLPAMMPYEDIQIQMVDMPPITETCYEGWLSNIVRSCDIVLLVVGVDDLDPDGSLRAIRKHMEDASVTFTVGDASGGEGEGGGEGEDDFRAMAKKTMVVVNKADLGEADLVRDLIRPEVGDLAIHETSCLTGAGLEDLRGAIYQALSIVRVYTKIPGKKADLSRPYVVKRGTTVMGIARMIHKDFAEHLRFARLWGHARFEGQPVEKSHVLEDRDVLEIHI